MEVPSFILDCDIIAVFFSVEILLWREHEHSEKHCKKIPKIMKGNIKWTQEHVRTLSKNSLSENKLTYVILIKDQNYTMECDVIFKYENELD